MLFFAISGIGFWMLLIYRLVFLPGKIKNKDYEMMSYCSDCHRDTLHLHHEDDIEGESSGDYKICLTCRKHSKK